VRAAERLSPGLEILTAQHLYINGRIPIRNENNHRTPAMTGCGEKSRDHGE
jgi:hypothetical protein